MEYNPKVHRRRSIRLPHYDYSLPGAYFVTICAFGKRCVFGSVVGDQMRENDCGKIVREQWLDTVRIRPQIELDAFTVMPNHLHGILWILAPDAVGPKSLRPVVGTSTVGPGPKSLRPIVGPSTVGPGPKALRPYDRPNAVRPYNIGAAQSPIGPANPIPPMRPRSLASWVSGFKSAVTGQIRKLWNDPYAVVWQEDYFEGIVRDEKELLNIRDYILSNPLRWKLDRENSETEPNAEDDVPWGQDDES